MEANELMVGDWVNFNLYPFAAPYTPCKVSLDAIYKAAKGADVLRFEPIPLTPEILIANGFRFIESKRLLFIPDEGGSISYHTDTHCINVGGDGCVKKNIGYVHELQHALRLCGLTELADNFKI